MRNLYIVGAGGFGREVYCWLLDTCGSGTDWDFCGFLDDDPDALRGMDYGKGVVSSISDFIPKASDRLVCGLGSVQAKQKLCLPLIERGAKFETVIHPSVIIGKNVNLGDGVVLCPGVILTCDINIGGMAMINCHSSAGHDVTIGDWSTISAHCDLTGHTKLGVGVFFGSGARIIPGKSVGDGSVVGAGSVVIRSVGVGQKVFGNPARAFA